MIREHKIERKKNYYWQECELGKWLITHRDGHIHKKSREMKLFRSGFITLITVCAKCGMYFYCSACMVAERKKNFSFSTLGWEGKKINESEKQNTKHLKKCFGYHQKVDLVQQIPISIENKHTERKENGSCVFQVWE